MTQLHRPDSSDTGEFRVYVEINRVWWPMTYAMSEYSARAVGAMLCQPWRLVEIPKE